MNNFKHKWNDECLGLSVEEKRLWTRACLMQKIEDVKDSLSGNVNINALNNRGVSLLHNLIKFTAFPKFSIEKQTEIFDLLVQDKNLDINLRLTIHNNTEGRTILFTAIEVDRIDMVKNILARPETDLNVKYKRTLNVDGLRYETPLWFAFKTNKEIAKLLLNDDRLDINSPVLIDGEKTLDCIDCINYFYKDKPETLFNMKTILLDRADFECSPNNMPRLLSISPYFNDHETTFEK